MTDPAHFSKSISQTTTFWELGLGFFGIRIILTGKLGLYAGVKFWSLEEWGTTLMTNLQSSDKFPYERTYSPRSRI